MRDALGRAVDRLHGVRVAEAVHAELHARRVRGLAGARVVVQAQVAHVAADRGRHEVAPVEEVERLCGRGG